MDSDLGSALRMPDEKHRWGWENWHLADRISGRRVCRQAILANSWRVRSLVPSIALTVLTRAEKYLDLSSLLQCPALLASGVNYILT